MQTEPSIDPLEFARGTLSAACFVAANQSCEVHITRLSKFFDRAGIASGDVLDKLSFLREAEALGGGYWIPAPTRTVGLTAELSLVVGIQPTQELRRHFPSVKRAGIGRTARTSELSALPMQTLASWREADGLDACQWARSVIQTSLAVLGPSICEEKLEVFGVKSRPTSKDWEPTWAGVGAEAACAWSGVSLFRARTGKSSYRHFLGKFHNKSGLLEGPAIQQVSRMQFGLAALQERPLRLRITSRNGATLISLPLSPPSAVRRLLLALCEEDRRSFGRNWYCQSEESQAVLQNTLNELSGDAAHYD